MESRMYSRVRATLKKVACLGLVSMLLLVWMNQTSAQDQPQAKAAQASKSDKIKKPTSFWPDEVEWNAEVPTPKSYFGFEVGFRHLDHSQIAGYMKLLAQTSERVTLQQYGTTHGGRPLLLVKITSPKNHQRIEQIRKDSKRLSKPGAGKVDISDLPAVINMGYGVHGDESSATNCTPLVAHYLAAAQGEAIEKLLDNVVVLLDPSLNPDGFNRFANWANRYRGKVLNPDPQHAEHNQQWPPGRVNYYWFDLNRDWLPLVHPESRGRMRWYHQWKPNVVLDFHEMGTNSTYFFQPGIPERTNPLTPAKNVELTNRFGEYHAKALDARGSLYYTQESFDDFYMGKGSTYPDLHGAVGILFEQASSRGHIQENQDGVLKFHDTIANHFATSLSSLKATLDMREELHEHKRSFYQESMELGGKSDKQTYLFSAPYNRDRVQKFAATLLRHDIQCYWLSENLEYGDRTFDKRWTLVVPTKQPEFRFIKSLLMRRTRFKENIFYDVSSWTLPLAYGINQTSIKKNVDTAKLVPAKINAKWNAGFEFGDQDVAYLVDWRHDGAQRLLAQLLFNEVKVRVAKKPFAYGSGESAFGFGVGTLQIPLGVQPKKKGLIRKLLKDAFKQGVPVTAVTTGRTTQGIDLGSNNYPVIKERKLAMLTGRNVSAYGAGEVWHHLDTRLGLPVTMIKDRSLARASLDDYSTMILPSGSYSSLGDKEWSNLKEFASEGGTIIATGGSAGMIAMKVTGKKELEFDFDKDKKEGAKSGVGSEDSTPKKAKATPKKSGEIQKPFDNRSAERALKLISGAIFKTQVDLTHPLAYGLTKDHLPVFRNHGKFLKPSENAYANPFIYDQEQPLMAGYCSDENVERFKGAASVVVYPVGRGRIILISDNPNFRGFWHGPSRIMSNAIFFGDLVN